MYYSSGHGESKRVIFFTFFLLFFLLLSLFCNSADAENQGGTAADSGLPVAEQSSEELEQLLITEYSYGDGHISEKVSDLLLRLSEEDQDEGEKWQSLMNLWEYVNTDMNINTGSCPDMAAGGGNPVIVVMGFHLNPRGSMREELVRRCRAALKCAKKYPDSYIIVTGGATASKNPEATEADAMAVWLIRHGVERSRILVERKAHSTYENAIYSCRLLEDKGIVPLSYLIVTSDYHVRRSCMVFAAETVLSGTTGIAVENYACKTVGSQEESLYYQAADVQNIIYFMRYYSE